LPENGGLAFGGPRVPPAFVVDERTARRFLARPNPTGRPNSDVLRPLIGAADLARPRHRWVVDFPEHFDPAEPPLYAAPFRRLERTRCQRRGRWWALPRTGPGLRAALARHDRFLVVTRDACTPHFTWLMAPALPDDSLLVVARDDDFVHGVLQSHAFAAWWRTFRGRRAAARLVLAFPFPWPPETPLARLSAAQEERRHAVARAARAGAAREIDEAVAAAYGWPADLASDTLLARLLALHRRRTASPILDT
jgi:hypothetical protein